MIRRMLLAGATAVLAATALAPGALAAPEDWAGSQITEPAEPPTTVSSTPFPVRALLVRSYDARTHRIDAVTELLAPAEQEAGCSTAITTTTVEPQDGGSRHTTSAQASTSCNGVFTVRVTARLIRTVTFGGGERVEDTHVMERTIHVAAPPPDVTAVATAPGDDRSVVVGWTPVANPPPDMLGYVVERVTASGGSATIATIDDPEASSYTDEDPPAEGGTTTYRVRARRAGPQGEVTSSNAGEATAEVEPAPEPEEPADPGTDPGSGGGGGGDGNGGDGPPAPGGDAPPGTSGGAPFRPPTVGRSSSSVVPPLRGTVTTLDTGFDEELPFGERELGDEDPVLPDDEFASMIYEDEAGRGLLIPIATALLLAVWAVHLRYLAAAAKPE